MVSFFSTLSNWNALAVELDFKVNLLFLPCSAANSSPKIFSKPFRGAQHMNFTEQQELKDAPWFQAGIPRDISLEVLSKQTPGAFLVRQSNSKPGCFVLSLRVPPPLPKVAHYLILRTSRGYKIKVSPGVFPSSSYIYVQ